MLEKNVVVHIGGNKTGSTLLQKNVFSQSPSVSYLGEYCHNHASISDLLDCFVHADAYYYDKKEFARLVEPMVSADTQTIVFSNEDIMGSRFSTRCAERILELFPNAKILIVIRNQLTVWPSWYVNHGAYLKHVPQRYWRRYVSFDEWIEYCFLYSAMSSTIVEAMNYWKYYSIYSKLFGKNRVCVLPYEDMLNNPKRFSKELASLLGIDPLIIERVIQCKKERGRYSRLKHKLHKNCSLFPNLGDYLYSIIDRYDWTNPYEPTIPPRWNQKILDYYAHGNSQLAQACGIELEKYHYPLASKQDL